MLRKAINLDLISLPQLTVSFPGTRHGFFSWDKEFNIWNKNHVKRLITDIYELLLLKLLYCKVCCKFSRISFIPENMQWYDTLHAPNNSLMGKLWKTLLSIIVSFFGWGERGFVWVEAQGGGGEEGAVIFMNKITRESKLEKKILARVQIRMNMTSPCLQFSMWSGYGKSRVWPREKHKSWPADSH